VTAMITSPAMLTASDPQMLPAFREAGIPFLSDIDTQAQVKGKIGRVPKDALDAALARWQEEQDRIAREKKLSMVEHIFKEYKSERGKEVRKGG